MQAKQSPDAYTDMARSSLKTRLASRDESRGDQRWRRQGPARIDARDRTRKAHGASLTWLHTQRFNRRWHRKCAPRDGKSRSRGGAHRCGWQGGGKRRGGIDAKGRIVTPGFVDIRSWHI
jgi:hypothetical protein